VNTVRSRCELALQRAGVSWTIAGLTIPYRHAVEYFDLTRDEVFACDELLRIVRERVCALKILRLPGV
jgi:hypothetical protein